LKQLYPEPLFKLRDLPADRRLGSPERLSRRREASAIHCRRERHHRREIVEVAVVAHTQQHVADAHYCQCR
jgi:hypothetical protein